MLIVLDIGNNHVTIGGFDADDIRFVAAIATDERQTGEQYACALRNVLALYGAAEEPIEGAVICSVVPAMVPLMERAMGFLTRGPVLTVGAGVRTGLNIKVDQPRAVGSDRVVCAVWACRTVPMPCVIVDLGTATTFTILDREGAMVGSAIAAGVRVSLDALKDNAAQLPKVGLAQVPGNVLGRTTADAMKIGAVYGTAAMIDGMIDRCAEALGERPTVLLTGGAADVVRPHLHTPSQYEPLLALRGLRYIWEKNHPQAGKAK